MNHPDPGAPTPERRRRSAFVVGSAVATEAGPAQAGSRVYRCISVLQRLAKAAFLEPRQAQAGERFLVDWELGVEGARETASGSSSTTGWAYPEARLAALRRCELALAALGPTAECVLHVVVLDASLSDLAKALRRNRQEIAGILKLGLTALADHYRI